MKIHLNFPGKSARTLERGLFAAGFALLGLVAAVYAHRAIMVRAELRQFEAARFQEIERAKASKSNQAAGPQGAASTASSFSGRAEGGDPSSDSDRDPLLRRSAERISTHGSADGAVPSRQPGRTLGVLRIPSLQLEVPLLNGTDSITLNRGVGRIAGTAFPGDAGNMAIAGHRDGFFRRLGELHTGDRIELATANATLVYTVERTLVTDPGDLSVLDARGKPTLTLVTCYPFHYIGTAPRRFVVEASLQE